MAIHFVKSSRVAVNRTNALKSTGPRTPAGKARSSLNAVKTGLTGRTVLLPYEDVGEYRAHVERFWDELQPVGELEGTMAQSLADTQWRLSRIPGLESAILAVGRKKCAKMFREEKNQAVRDMLIEGQAQSTEAGALKNLYLQESRLRRRYDQDMKELRTLQAERERQRSQGASQRQEETERARRGQEKKTTRNAPVKNAANSRNTKKAKKILTTMASNLQTPIQEGNKAENRDGKLGDGNSHKVKKKF